MPACTIRLGVCWPPLSDSGLGDGPMRKILLASVVSAAIDPAAACGFNYGSGWTVSGGGTPGQLIVLGAETCTGSVQGSGLQIIAPPLHGKVKVTGANSYTYAPNRGYRGPDSFKVSANAPGVGLVIGTIAVTVQ
jgi:hypothetical protein